MYRFLFVLIVAGIMSCGAGPAGKTKDQQPDVYMSALINGNAWKTESVTLNPLGNLWVIKGADEEGRVLSLTLPRADGVLSLPVEKGGTTTITWSVSREEGFTYAAPYNGYDNSGIIVITLNEPGYLAGEFHSPVSNGGKVINIEKGQFSVRLTE